MTPPNPLLVQLHDAARAHYAAGRYRAAVGASLAALRALDADASALHRAACANALGMALAALGHLRWAQRCYAAAEAGYAAGGDAEGAAMARNNRGTVLYLLGQYRPALDLQREALATLKALGSDLRTRATGLRNVGTALHKLGDFAAARAHFDEALELLSAGGSEMRDILGALRLCRGAARYRLADLSGAETDYRAALDLAQDTAAECGQGPIADAQWHLAEALLAQGQNASEAAALARQAAAIAASTGRADFVWRCLNVAARATPERAARVFIGKLAAWTLWRDVQRVAAGERVVRAGFVDARGHAYRDLAGDLIESGRLVEAFAIGATADRLGVGAALPLRWAASAPIPFDDRERAARNTWDRLAQAASAHPGDAAHREALETWLAAPLVQRAHAAPAADSTRAVRLRAPPRGHVRIQFACGDRAVRIAIASADGQHAAAPVEWPSVQLAHDVYAFAHACRSDADLATVQHLGHNFYRRLLAPICAAFPDGTTHVEIMADGPLRVLPWAALWTGSGYLVERFAILVVCGGAAAAHAGAGKIATFAAAAGGPDAVALPHAVREATAIAALYGAQGAAPCVDAAFTLGALSQAIAQGAAGLHIASHFSLDPVDLGRSRLRLGDGAAVAVAALAALDFTGVREVVLSACDGGLAAGSGDAKSLPDILAALGVGAVVAALWPVPDATTADLMIAYHAARRTGADPATALATAQRAAIAGLSPAAAAPLRGIGDEAEIAVAAAPRGWAGFCAFGAVAPAPKDGE